MSVKRIILFVAILLVVIATTVVALYFLNSNKTDIYSRGVRPTEDSVFEKVANISGLPMFAELPAEKNGWKKATSSAETTYAHVQFTRDDTCTLDVTAQLLPNTEKDKKDFQLSQALVDTTARSVNGTTTEPYIIPVQSEQGGIDFYSALYNPTIKFVHSSGTVPTDQGGSEKLEGDFTTYIAARVFGNDLSVGENTAQSAVSEGIVSLGAVLPAVVVVYTCKTTQFDVNDALALMSDIRLDVSNVTQIVPATTGK